MKWRKDEWKELAAYLSGEMDPQGEIAYREQLLRRMEDEGEIAALPPPGSPVENTEIPLEPLTRVPRPSVILQSRPPTPPPPTQPTRKGKEPVSTAHRTPG